MARSASLPPPRDWMVDGTFPAGRMRVDAPTAVLAAAEVAARLTAAMAGAGLSKRELAARAGVSRSALYALLTGEVFPDFVTVARLGEAVGVPLWPRTGRDG